MALMPVFPLNTEARQNTISYAEHAFHARRSGTGVYVLVAEPCDCRELELASASINSSLQV